MCDDLRECACADIVGGKTPFFDAKLKDARQVNLRRSVALLPLFVAQLEEIGEWMEREHACVSKGVISKFLVRMELLRVAIDRWNSMFRFRQQSRRIYAVVCSRQLSLLFHHRT